MIKTWKRRSIGMMLIAMGFATSQCNKNVDFKLPSVTSSGANTMGFVVNDYVWVPFMKCETLQSACLAQMAYVAPPALEFSFARQYRDKKSYLYIKTPLDASVSSIGEKVDSIAVSFYSEDASPTMGVYTGPLPGSKFTITRFDAAAKVISGEFHFILGDQDNTIIELKSGRFDFNFPACHCD